MRRRLLQGPPAGKTAGGPATTGPPPAATGPPTSPPAGPPSSPPGASPPASPAPTGSPAPAGGASAAAEAIASAVAAGDTQAAASAIAQARRLGAGESRACLMAAGRAHGTGRCRDSHTMQEPLPSGTSEGFASKCVWCSHAMVMQIVPCDCPCCAGRGFRPDSGYRPGHRHRRGCWAGPGAGTGRAFSAAAGCCITSLAVIGWLLVS